MPKFWECLTEEGKLIWERLKRPTKEEVEEENLQEIREFMEEVPNPTKRE